VLCAGLTPRGGGTIGAVAALPLTCLLARIDLLPRIAILIALTALSVFATAQYLRYEKRFLDPKEVVIDELVGVSIAVAFVPWTFVQVAGAFFLFRLLDITKPGPIRWLEHRLPGAWGVVFDDVLAGLLAGLAMLLLDRANLL
jgi:phosphatidylglycerophosphatase A